MRLIKSRSERYKQESIRRRYGNFEEAEKESQESSRRGQPWVISWERKIPMLRT